MKKYPKVSESTIWNFRQNNPELVVRDAMEYLGLDEDQAEVLRTILLARGINKWLAVRRDLIAHKSLLKIKIRELQAEIKELRTTLKEAVKRGERDGKIYTEWRVKREVLKTLEEERAILRRLCHSDRLRYWRPSVSRRVLREMNTISVGVEI